MRPSFPLLEAPEPFPGSSVIQVNGNACQGVGLDLRSGSQASSIDEIAMEVKVKNVLSQNVQSEKGRGTAPSLILM